MTAVLPFAPFPPLHWWYLATGGHGGSFAFETDGHFAKQTLRNRMVISGPQGKVVLSFPLQAKEVNSDERDRVLSPHFAPTHSFRTLKSAYGGAPFFEHFEEDLRHIWKEYLPNNTNNDPRDIKHLTAFNRATIEWVAATCDWTLHPLNVPLPAFERTPIDLRDKHTLAGEGWAFQRYTQLFEQTNGFVPGCSILDALMTLGPTAVHQQIHCLTQRAT
jgi:hypothetical protein|tara:strand:+ start:10132 stop:10785 length:654 start_codon:yes stop_codon:yes gene_type:complete